jgi:hypothetical protein
LGEDLFGHETEFVEDPLGSPEVLRGRRIRKSHYIAPPPVPTNPESRLIIKPLGRGNHFLYSQSIMVIHANTTCQGTSHKRQVNVVLGNLVHMHYPSEVYALARTTMLLLLMRCMEPLRWQCGVTSRYVFWLSFFKVLSLTHLTLLLLDFEIAEMIPLAKRRHAGPRKECV